ncbi:MAG: nuclear transport factor 2 family protein [Spirochaetota bacterium]
MSQNKELIEKFYSSFQKKDIDGMLSCYHEDVSFDDPVFQGLKGWKANAMWKMLVERGKDMELSYHSIEANDTEGSAFWEPIYTFSKTGNTIHNKISAKFTFKDGKIYTHKDHFDLWRWIQMAMGLKGLLLGWLPPVQDTVRKEANSGLAMYIKRKRLDPTAPTKKKKES